MLRFSSQKFRHYFNRVGVYYKETPEAAYSTKSFLLQPPTNHAHHSQWYNQHLYYLGYLDTIFYFASKIMNKNKYQTLTLEFSQSPSKQLVLNIDNKLLQFLFLHGSDLLLGEIILCCVFSQS